MHVAYLHAALITTLDKYHGFHPTFINRILALLIFKMDEVEEPHGGIKEAVIHKDVYAATYIKPEHCYIITVMPIWALIRFNSRTFVILSVAIYSALVFTVWLGWLKQSH